MIRLEAFLAALLDSQQDAERRQLLHRYLIWHLIRRLRSRNNGSPATRQQSLMIRRLARGAIAFLDWLDAHDLTLNSCQQADLDRWLTDERAAYREEAGRFIRWARCSKLTACYLPAAPRWNGPRVEEHPPVTVCRPPGGVPMPARMRIPTLPTSAKPTTSAACPAKSRS